MTTEPVSVTDADRATVAEILSIVDASCSDHAHDELLLLVAEHRLASEQRTPTVQEADIDKAWDALKARVCADPSEAKRCVMVGKHDFIAAVRALPLHPVEGEG